MHTLSVKDPVLFPTPQAPQVPLGVIKVLGIAPPGTTRYEPPPKSPNVEGGENNPKHTKYVD